MNSATQIDRPSAPVVSHHARPALLFAAVVVVDQATKTLAHLGGDRAFVEPVHNTDYALGIVGSHPWLLSFGTIVAIVAVVAWSRRTSVPLRWWIVPAFAAGALANLADRIVLGGVRDFIPTPWLVFNIADVAVAAAVLTFYVDRLRRPCRNSTAEGGESNA